MLEQAQAAHRAGRLEDAELLYRRILTENSQSIACGDAAAGLGALLRACNRHKEAGLHYHWALHHCRWSPLLLSNACNWLRDKGEAKESLIWLYKGLQEWPQDLHLRWGQVLSLHKAERPQQALHYLDELIQEQGQRPLLLQERVACLLSCGRNDEALSTLKALRGQKPNDATLLLQELTLLQRLQKRKRLGVF